MSAEADYQASRPRRPQYGECPYCGAGEDNWCLSDCSALDPMDYR